MADDDTIVEMILIHVSGILGKPVRSVDDLLKLSAERFLDLIGNLDDEILPFFISMFKSSSKGRELFHKLTEEPDDLLRDGANAFLKRYRDLLLRREEPCGRYNPLLVYLPSGCFDDLAFMQSRQPFFLRQTIDTINEFLHEACGCGETFGPGQQEEAWGWFWSYLLRR